MRVGFAAVQKLCGGDAVIRNGAQTGARLGAFAATAFTRGDDGVLSFVAAPRPVRRLQLAAEPEPLEIDLAASALVIVDMQNDFCHPQGWFPAAKGVDPAPLVAPVPAIRGLKHALGAHGVPTVYVNWGVRADVANLPPTVLAKGSGCGRAMGYGEPSPAGDGRILVAGDWGARVIDALAPEPGDIEVYKHRISAFRDNELDSVLQQMGVSTLIFTGINIDRCVFASLMDASFAGYHCLLVTDACATPSAQPVIDSVIFLTRLLYGFTTTSAAMEAALADLGSSP
jgi:nicotinamidase-related amidase